MKIDARGSQKEPHRSNFAFPGGSSGVLLGRLGRQVGLRRALWAEKRSLKIERKALGTILGSSWRVLGILGRISRPLGGPGETPGGHFWTFLGRPSRDLKNELLFVVFSHIWGLFSVLLFALSCLPCSVAGGVVHVQKIENLLVFVGRKLRLVMATPEAINFKWGRVINNGAKKS